MFPTIVIAGFIAGYAVWVLVRHFRRSVRGDCGCGGCEGCPSRGMCHAPEREAQVRE